MVIKVIRVATNPGSRADYLSLQRRWNAVMAAQDGFQWCHVGIGAEPDEALVVVAFASRAHLDRFMTGAHDEMAAETDIASTYDRLDVRVYDVVQPEPSGVAGTVDQPDASPAAAIVDLTQGYRTSAALYWAVEIGLFDAVAAGTPLGTVADDAGLELPVVESIAALLESTNLLTRDHAGQLTCSDLAGRFLVRASPEQLCDLVLHDARPELFERSATLGGPTRHRDPNRRFAAAMEAIARAGQSDRFVEALARSALSLDGAEVLDVGGSTGPYARALAARWQTARITVLDRPEVVDLVDAATGAPGDRVRFVGGDYRVALPGGPFDAVLLSNVVRGETAADLDALLRRVRTVLRPGGAIVVQDLVAVDEHRTRPRGAALFGLHLPGAANPSLPELFGILGSCGFQDPVATMVDGYVTSNAVIVARVSRDGPTR